MQTIPNRRNRIVQIAAVMFPLVAFASAAQADIFQWEYINPADPSQGKRQSTTLAPDGAGVDAVPGADLSYRNLTMSYLVRADLTGTTSWYANLTDADLSQANLTNASLNYATLTGADFTDAQVTGANFLHDSYTRPGPITLAQLYSTASYQAHDLNGIGLSYINLAGANFAGRNLTNASFTFAKLTGADFTDSEVKAAYFDYTDLTLAQLYSTASYRVRDLTGINLTGIDLSGANFVSQNLTNAILGGLADADLFGAEVRGADLFYITPAQLYSTASYQAHDLTGIGLGVSDFTGASFAGQNLTNADFGGATLTDADFTGAEIRGATFGRFVARGGVFSAPITPVQLYSTASYEAHDLSGVRLIGQDLAGANFAGQNLTNAVFDLATLTDLNFAGADLSHATLRGAKLQNASLIGAKLFGADFGPISQNPQSSTFTNLTGAKLSQADLRNANFIYTFLTDAEFTGAEVRGANFRGSITLAQLYSTASYQARDLRGIGLSNNNLAGANFAGQNLTNASFSGTTLTDADFTGAEIRGASFYRSASLDGTGISVAQLYSSVSYQAHDLSGVNFSFNDLAGANFAGQNLSNANFGNATLTGADLSGADARGAYLYQSDVITTNLIRPDGHINGLELDAGGLLMVRDYDGNPLHAQPTLIPITVDQHLAMGPGGTLRMVFEADAWDSTISFAPGIPVALGGTLELTFAADVNPASQVGRTFDLFDWTGVTPTGAFTISTPYAWDLSNLYTTGEITLTAIPEPSTAFLLASAVTVWGIKRRGIHRVRRSALSIACLGSLLAGPSPAFGQFNLVEATIPQMQVAMESGEITSEALVMKYLQRIANLDDAGPMLNSILALNPGAIERARALDQERLATGPRGPLHGIPILLKDNIDTFDQPTTAGALILEGSIPPDDAFLTQKLRDAGAVILGKANLHEFSGLVSRTMPLGFSALGGQTLNPYGPGVITPGGSSTGSAVSVGANLVAAAVGTETQGSIVLPAMYNSVVGIRPTVGLISRDGIIPISHTQDTAGPLTRTVTDAAIMLGAMAGVDPNDPKTLSSIGHTPAEYTQFLNPNGLQGKRLGFVRDPLVFTIDPTEVPLTEAAIDALEQGGATVVDNIDFSANVIDVVNLWGTELPKVFSHEFVPGIENYLASLGENAPASTLAEIIAFNAANAAQAIPYGQGDMLAALATGGDLNDPAYIAQRDEAIRLMGTDGIDALLDANNLDALVFPYDWPSLGAVPGYPAIEVPAGFNVNGVPFSFGFVGKPFSEPELIEIAFAFEQATLLRRPPVLLPGDFNHDGTVDAADYVVWRKGLGTTYTQADYNDWRTYFGQTLIAGSGATAGDSAFAVASLPSKAVPEPASLMLLLIAAINPRVLARCGRMAKNRC